MTVTCPHCGARREPGDVCCPASARHQGRLHSGCNHPPPALPDGSEMPGAWLAAYEAGAEEVTP